MISYSQHAGDLTFAVRVIPRSSRSEIAGKHNGALHIRVAASPVKGAANRELVRLLAKTFKVSQNAVEIVSGPNSKNKVVRIAGADAATLQLIASSKTRQPPWN